MIPSKKIRGVSQIEIQKSYPTQEEVDALPKKMVKDLVGKEVEKPDTAQLEKETVGNVILNCLSRYKPEDKKENIFINVAMQSIWDVNEGEEIELKKKVRDFIVKVVVNQTIHDEVGENGKKEEVGSYYGWATSQVLRELGEKIEGAED